MTHLRLTTKERLNVIEPLDTFEAALNCQDTIDKGFVKLTQSVKIEGIGVGAEYTFAEELIYVNVAHIISYS